MGRISACGLDPLRLYWKARARKATPRAIVSLGTLTALVALTCYAWADVIELRTGQRIEGSLKEANAEQVSVEVAGQTITFKTEQVRAVYFGRGPASASSQAPSPAQEALTALKSLQSVAEGGVSYRDYAPRVSDAKIVVDRYLGSAATPGEDALRAAIAKAMGFYVLASSAWNTKISKAGRGDRADYETIGSNPLLGECAPVQQEIENAHRKNPRMKIGDPVNAGLVMVFDGFPALWQCARARIAEADHLILSK